MVLQEASKGTLTPKDIQGWINSRVAKHKWLGGGVSLVDEIPKLASGKIPRKIVWKWATSDAATIEKQVNAWL